MPLALTGTEDQAVLAAVIGEARKAADESGSFVGRTAVQKIMYFLKATGVPVNYRFDIYHYGPFCEDIMRDTEWLMADGVIVDRSGSTEKYSNYAPGDEIEAILSLHQSLLSRFGSKIESVSRALASMRPEKLELLATLDYLYRHAKASGGSGPWKKRVVERFMQVKGDKFPPDEVEQTYDIMAEVGILEA